MEEFRQGVKIVSGENAVESIRRLGKKRVFAVTDQALWASGMAKKIGEALAEESEFFPISEATAENVAAGAEKLIEFCPDLVAVFGGEEAIFGGKVMALCGRQGQNTPFSVAVFPSLSGSGSQVTNSASLSQNGARRYLVHQDLCPDTVVLVPALAESLDQQTLAREGFQVLATALESYTSRNSGVFSELYARQGFCTCLAALPAAYAGQKAPREKLQLASTLAGIAASHSGTGLCQAMSRTLGELFCVQESLMTAVLLPAVLNCNAHVAGRRYAELSRAAGLGGSSESLAVAHLKNSIVRLRRELDLPQTLRQAGIEPRRVWQSMGAIVRGTLAQPCCRDNPMEAEDFLIRRILEEVTGRV